LSLHATRCAVLWPVQVVADGGLEKPYNWDDCGKPMVGGYGHVLTWQGHV
jgi:hypothetical protein